MKEEMKDIGALTPRDATPVASNEQSLGERLSALRRRDALSLERLAGFVGCTKAHLWELEKGRSSNPSLTLLVALADRFGVSIDYLAGRLGGPALHGPCGYLIKVNGLGEDDWRLRDDPSPSPHEESLPLYALVDPFKSTDGDTRGEADPSPSLRTSSSLGGREGEVQREDALTAGALTAERAGSDAEIAAQLRKLLNAYPLGTMDWPLDVMTDAAAALERRATLVSFTKDALSEFWARDTPDIQELGIKYGLLVEAVYDPEKHGDVEDSEPGDTIYVYADWLKANTVADTRGDSVPPPSSARERREIIEECAKVCDEFDNSHNDGHPGVASAIARAIRALSSDGRGREKLDVATRPDDGPTAPTSTVSSGWLPIGSAPKDGMTTVRLYAVEDGYLDACGFWSMASAKGAGWTLTCLGDVVCDEDGKAVHYLNPTHWKPLGEAAGVDEVAEQVRGPSSAGATTPLLPIRGREGK